MAMFQQLRAKRSAEDVQLWCDLPHHAIIILSTSGGSAIEIALTVEGHVADWISSVAVAGEVMKRSVRPTPVGLRELEHCAVCVTAVSVRGAVKIASRIHGEAGLGAISPGKAVQDIKYPGAIG